MKKALAIYPLGVYTVTVIKKRKVRILWKKRRNVVVIRKRSGRRKSIRIF